MTEEQLIVGAWLLGAYLIGSVPFGFLIGLYFWSGAKASG